jgi:hypothetical protein
MVNKLRASWLAVIVNFAGPPVWSKARTSDGQANRGGTD